MLIVFQEEERNDLVLLRHLSDEDISDICSLAIDSIKCGLTSLKKSVSSLVKRINASGAFDTKKTAEDIHLSIRALSHIFTHASKLNLSIGDLSASLMDISSLVEQDAITSTKVDTICGVYKENLVSLREFPLTELSKDMNTLNFVDLAWRLDAQRAKRNLRDIVEPKFVLRLDTRKGAKKRRR